MTKSRPALVLVLVLLACNDRIAVDGGELGEGSEADTDTASAGPLDCADAWDGLAPAPALDLHRAALASDEPWTTVAQAQLGTSQVLSDGASLYWNTRPSASPGALLRADLDGANLEVLDTTTGEPDALLLDAASGWIYYADNHATTTIRRVRSDGSASEELAAAEWDVFDIALSEDHVWWGVPIAGQIWRMPKAGGEPELFVGEDAGARQIEVAAGFVWGLDVRGLFRMSADATDFIDGHLGPYELVVADEFIYLVARNTFGETHLGWIHRYPMHAGEYMTGEGEFVIDKVSPRPTAIRGDAEAIYWATADEDSGQGGIWMLCRSAL